MSDYKEIFKLAQEKGYKYKFIHPEIIADIKESEYTLLELTLIQAWLREEYKLHVIVKPYHDVYEFQLWTTGAISLEHTFVTDGFLDTYPQALLDGIYEALKLI